MWAERGWFSDHEGLELMIRSLETIKTQKEVQIISPIQEHILSSFNSRVEKKNTPQQQKCY